MLVVYLQEGDVAVELRVGTLLELVEDHRERSRDDAAVGISVDTAGNGKGLSTAGLSVCKYSRVVPVERALHGILSNYIEYALLR